MIPEFDMLQVLIFSVLAFGAFIAYKTWSGGSAAAPDTFTTKIFLITRRREIYEQMVENQNNIMLPKKGGYGYLERVNAVVIYRYGRVKKQYFELILELTDVKPLLISLRNLPKVVRLILLGFSLLIHHIHCWFLSVIDHSIFLKQLKQIPYRIKIVQSFILQFFYSCFKCNYSFSVNIYS